ncbi:4-alpha-glucanotransferase [Thiolapillus brandeum]|uniref:4-alpha-glucanotransferase n=1 Tax=Thiolapillus brandeum TaxID=1076588 RepID=A0A7U6JID2_9GAMM|nr:4-alpha-glucanotransferase [Thiolapillus brandeum]BAO45186.1 4-alpha-glucanotransferase [Thiolapillus brandeum]
MPYEFSQRRAGVLLHPTSLPSGTLDDADAWLDFMQASGLSVWQVLPLGVPQADLSPYQCLSAFATNPALLREIPEYRDDDAGFAEFCAEEAHWLDDYALFVTLKEYHDHKAWYDWPTPYKQRNRDALAQFQQRHGRSVQEIRWQQYQLHRRWRELQRKAQARNIRLFGDMPIFVAHDSSDVWACPRRFLLDRDGQPTWVTGVPPDYFSETGQRWGNPHYDWDYHQQEGFQWWLARLSHHFRWFDLVRIDHFRGLQAVWMIPADEPTAENGHWQKVPGDALLASLKKSMQHLPLVAEDLGIITPEVKALKKKYDLPGMAVLQFAFDAFEDNPHKPVNITPKCAAYTGTHDNDTTLGWYQSLDHSSRQRVHEMLHMQPGDDPVDAMIDTLFHTRANLAVVPMQDFLKLGSEARMNTPGVPNGNWRWRLPPQSLSTPDLPGHILEQVINSKRKVTP